jgi:hypothetical protein
MTESDAERKPMSPEDQARFDLVADCHDEIVARLMIKMDQDDGAESETISYDMDVTRDENLASIVQEAMLMTKRFFGHFKHASRVDYISESGRNGEVKLQAFSIKVDKKPYGQAEPEETTAP